MKSLVLFFSIFICTSGLSSEVGLVILDMQEIYTKRFGYLKYESNQRKFKDLLKKQIELIELAKSKGLPIFITEYYINHTIMEGLIYRKKEHQAEVLPEILNVVSDYWNVYYVQKSRDDLFVNSRVKPEERYHPKLWWDISSYFIDKIDELNISKLIIAGANGGSCVKSTVQGALKNNIEVVVFQEAVIDFNFKEFIYPYYSKKFRDKSETPFMKKLEYFLVGDEKLHFLNNLSKLELDHL